MSTEDLQYIQSRGFAIMQGPPGNDETFPYITLREVQHSHCEATYHFTKKGWGGIPCKHPSNTEAEELAQDIVDLVLKYREDYPFPENRSIRVFMQDKEWRSVAQMLVERYSINHPQP